MSCLTLADLINKLNAIAEKSPELLANPVEIHFDTGCFSEAMTVDVRVDDCNITKVFISEN